MLNPVLLADIGGLFAIAFLLISFIGWIINLINAQNPPPAPNRGPQRRPRARDGKVQNEIEQFLQEAMGNRGRPAQQPVVGADEIEVLEAGPQRRGPQQAPTPADSRTRRKPPRRKPSGSLGTGTMGSAFGETASQAPALLPAQRPGSPGELVSSLSSLAETTVSSPLGSLRPRELAPAVTSGEGRGLGRPQDVQFLVGELRSREGMRKAIALQEILAPPRALRK